MKKITFLLCLLITFFSQAQKDKNKILEKGMYAEMTTSKGKILLQLEFEKTPGTVANFVGLAEGKIKNKHKGKNKPFYDGLKFHRVIENFMIQGGDAEGTGKGDPGYKFDNEIVPELKHDKPGILSMANAGPGTNGSQFFITHKKTPWLDGNHTVFGHVIEGQDIVNKIQKGDKIYKVKIIRKGKDAKNFKADKVFQKFQDEKGERIRKTKEEKEKELDALSVGFEKTESGLRYKFLQKGTGAIVKNGQVVSIHYTGKLANGTKFDSSRTKNKPHTFKTGVGNVIQGLDEAILLMKVGDKIQLVIPSELAYGKTGTGRGLIPPNATLIFDIELIKIK